MDEDLRTYLVRGGSAPARLARELDDDKTVASLSNWSFTQRWAWDELQRRVRVCLAAGRLPAGVLAHWAATVASGRELPAEQQERSSRLARTRRRERAGAARGKRTQGGSPSRRGNQPDPRGRLFDPPKNASRAVL